MSSCCISFCLILLRQKGGEPTAAWHRAGPGPPHPRQRPTAAAPSPDSAPKTPPASGAAAGDMDDGDTPRRKSVPDWLNSPIWSAPPPSPRHSSLPPTAPSPPQPPPSPLPPPQPRRDPTPIPPPNAPRDADVSDDEGKGAGAPSCAHLVAEFKVAVSTAALGGGDGVFTGC